MLPLDDSIFQSAQDSKPKTNPKYKALNSR